jgi:hypothetical protein
MHRRIRQAIISLGIAVLVVAAAIALFNVVPLFSASPPPITCRIGIVVDKSVSEVPGQQSKLIVSVQYPDETQQTRIEVPPALYADKEPGDTWKNCG